MPLVGGDVSPNCVKWSRLAWFAPRRRGCFRGIEPQAANVGGLPLVGGDVSDALSEITYYTWFAPRRRGCFRIPGADAEKDCICPS